MTLATHTRPTIQYHSRRSCLATGDGVDTLGELDGLGPLKPVTGADAEIDTEAAEKLEEAAAQEKPETEDPAAEAGKDDPRSRPWTDEEDATVRALVLNHGTKRWSLIAAQLTGRTGKQCRERWHNQLDPAIKKDNWTQEEDRTLLDAHRNLGAAAAFKASPLAPCPPLRPVAENAVCA